MAAPQADSRAQPLQTDAGQPVTAFIQNMEQPFPGHDLERPALESGGQELPRMPEVADREQKISYPMRRSSAQSGPEADRTQRPTGNEAVTDVDVGEHSAAPPMQMQQNVMPDDFAQLEPVMEQAQPIVPTDIPAVQDAGVEQSKPAYS